MTTPIAPDALPDAAAGALVGTRVVEFAGLGPAPEAARLLARLGARVVTIERPDAPIVLSPEPDDRREHLVADLGREGDRARVADLVAAADILIDPYRPGALERRGLGPDACLARNPRLVYARLTGYGQTGPLAAEPGHDLDFVALAGALALTGGRPAANVLGDYAGGTLTLVIGILAALVERQRSGLGQVVDASIVDGLTQLLAPVRRIPELRVTLADSAPWYAVYDCADGGSVAVAAVEPPFFAALQRGLGLDPELEPPQRDASRWAEVRARYATLFAARSRDEWVRVFAGTEACVVPVLDLDEAARHPQIVARGGVDAPAPRFSRAGWVG